MSLHITQSITTQQENGRGINTLGFHASMLSLFAFLLSYTSAPRFLFKLHWTKALYVLIKLAGM